MSGARLHEQVKAELDGKPRAVEVEGRPLRGCLQFNVWRRFFRVRSIEYLAE